MARISKSEGKFTLVQRHNRLRNIALEVKEGPAEILGAGTPSRDRKKSWGNQIYMRDNTIARKCSQGGRVRQVEVK